MNDGYGELVLTLQNIMYSDSELKYIAKERNIILFTMERICEENLTEEISEEATYRHCILVRKSTVDYMESLGYNLFRQFGSSQDSAYYERPLLRKSGDAYKTYKLLTTMDYSLDIYCFTYPSSRRRYPTVSSTIFVRNRSNIQNSSESTGDNPLANNQNGLEYFPDVSRLVSNGPRSSSGSIWGSRSRLPTALVEPISNNFSSEELSSSESEGAWEPRGLFVKLATIISTRSRLNSSSRGSIPDANDDEIRESPNLLQVDNHESSIPGMSGEGTVPKTNVSPGRSGGSTSLMRNDNITATECGVSGCTEKVDFDLDEVRNDVENLMKEECDNSGKCDSFVDNSKTTHDYIQINSKENTGNISAKFNKEFIRRMNVNKRTASCSSESQKSGFWWSKGPKQRKLSYDATEFSSSHSTNLPLEHSMIGNIRHSVSSLEPQESVIEKIEDPFYHEYPEMKCFNTPSTFQSTITDHEIINTHSDIKNHIKEKVTNINIEPSSSDKSSQKESLEDELRQNVPSIAMNSSSNNEHTTIEHLKPMAVVQYENQLELTDNLQHSSFTNIQRNKEYYVPVKPFDALQGSEKPCENRSSLNQIEKGHDGAPSHYSSEGILSQNETTTTNEYISADQIQDLNDVLEMFDPNEDLHNSLSDTDESYPFDTAANGPLSIERMERQAALYSFFNQNRITESFPYPDVVHEQLREAPKNNLNPNNYGLLSPMYVPLVWSRKCEDLQYLLSLKPTHPYSYTQEYNRIRKSNFSMLDCLRKRERSGALNQTKVMEVIAEPHYNIYPPAGGEVIGTVMGTVYGEEEMDLYGYLMVDMKTRRTFSSFPVESK